MKPLGRARLQRFDSVSEIVAQCRSRFSEAEVNTANEDGNFVLRVRHGHSHFESLIVHFEGEGCYAVELPAAI